MAPIHRSGSWASTPRPKPAPWLLGAVGLFLAALAAGTAITAPEVADVMRENGPVETVQAWMLVGGASLFFVAGLRSSDAKAAFCILVALAAVLAVRRELPGCASAFYEGGVCLAAGQKQFVTILAVVVALFALVAKRIGWKTVFRLSDLLWVWPILLSAALLGSAELFEALHHQEFEELLEFAAYVHASAFGLTLLKMTL